MKLSSKQRVIIASVMPILVIVLALSISSDVSKVWVKGRYEYDPFEWASTGHIWFLSVLGIGIFEMIIFRDRS